MRSTPVCVAASFFATVMLLMWPGKCDAEIPGFFPGDAFFLGKLSQESVDTLTLNEGTGKFSYVVPSEWAALCGHVGIRSIEIEGMSPKEVDRLKAAYRAYRTDSPKLLSVRIEDDGTERYFEQNPFHLLIYPRSFDHQKHVIGLKYNEGWNRPLEGLAGNLFSGKPSLGQHPPIFRSLIPEFDAVVTEWEFASSVPPLGATIPDGTPWNRIGDASEVSARIPFQDVVFYVVPHGEIADLFHKKEWASFMRIDSEATTLFRWKDVTDEYGDSNLELVSEKIRP